MPHRFENAYYIADTTPYSHHHGYTVVLEILPGCVVFKDIDTMVFAVLICTIRERQAEFEVIAGEWPDCLIRFERERHGAVIATELA